MGGARQRRRDRRRQLIASMGETSQQDGGDGDSRADEIMTSPIPELPQDLLFRIHALLPMRDAARAACVSRAFLHSWRCHPDLIFNRYTVSLQKSASAKKFHRKIDRILRNHLGISLRRFELDETSMCWFKGTGHLDGWLQIALKPGIEELTLVLSETKRNYNFPCSLLSDGAPDSLRYLKLGFCGLHPTVKLGRLRGLTSLHLSYVSITWGELEYLLSNSLALEKLDLAYCPEITRLKLPSSLRRLSYLSVINCSSLNVIESKAPNLSVFSLRGRWPDFSLVETMQIRKLDMDCMYCIRDARAKLPSIMPNLETLVISSGHEVVDAPMLPTKFHYLKHLTIWSTSGHSSSRPYDFLSLVSFLDASPSLETLILKVFQQPLVNESIFEDPELSHMPERRHGHLKSVEISRFSSEKSLVELTCYILENVVSLKHLTLDTICGPLRCDKSKLRCPILDYVVIEASRALSAIGSYIEYRVPSTVELTVVEPCSQCLDRGQQLMSRGGVPPIPVMVVA